MLLRQLTHFLKTKGPTHGLERIAEVFWRFAWGQRRFDRSLSAFEEVLERNGIRVTFCVTTSLLKRHRDLIERLSRQGHEIAAHGHIHTRLDLHSFEHQRTMIRRSWDLLHQHGLNPTGFRAPYLNFNDDTLRALHDSPFRWTSGEIVWWQNGRPIKSGVKYLKRLYHFVEPGSPEALPRFDGKLVHIPITAPDDELLFERQRVRDPKELALIWWNSFLEHHEKGGLHHQFFHPERFLKIREALAELINRVNELGDEVWKPTLGELAEWIRETNSEFRIPNSEVVNQRNSGDLEGPGVSVGAAEGKSGGSVGEFRNPKSESRIQDSEANVAGSEVSKDLGRPEGVIGEGPTKPGGPNSEFGIRNSEFAKPNWPHGAKSCFALSADVCAIDIWDFVDRARRF